MWTRQRRKTNRGRLVVPLLAAAFLGYFGFHAYYGDLGLYSTEKLDADQAQLKTELAGLTKRRSRLEHRVELLRDGSIEKDMLDEQARRQLNLSRPDEVTILLHPINE
jgi:cell division protein FtsB